MTDHLNRKLLIAGPGAVSYEETALAPPGPGQVVARTVVSGISHGTEMTAFLGTHPAIKKIFTLQQRLNVPRTDEDGPFYPWPYAGYDAVGIVEQVGEGVTRFGSGDRVWVPVPHQTRLLFDEDNPHPKLLSENISNEAAVFLNLTAVALGAVHDAAIKLGDSVAVFGGGIVGQLAAQLAALSGARHVYLVEPSAVRRQLAESTARIETIDPTAGSAALAIRERNGGAPPDVVIECSGSTRGLQDAIAAAGIAGTVVAAGFYAATGGGLNLGEEFLHNRVTVKASMGVWGCPSRYAERWSHERVIDESWRLLDERKINIDGFKISHMPFDQAQQAYEMIRDEPEKSLKIVLTY